MSQAKLCLLFLQYLSLVYLSAILVILIDKKPFTSMINKSFNIHDIQYVQFIFSDAENYNEIGGFSFVNYMYLFFVSIL